MGCRPSRRAVACVRIAGDGPWGRSSHPRTTGDGGVKLRQRISNKCRGDRDRGEGGMSKPRDRYSAPPTDRQFPPHSCTSATYKHGCCGTSRITLRLSKNGSTLEIEKCDFSHGQKSCDRCDQGDSTPNEEFQPLSLTVPQRTQSAPNLTVTPTEDCMILPSLPSRLNRSAVHTETGPPPLPPRGKVVVVERVDSPGSVVTATRIDVDVEYSIRPKETSSIGYVCDDPPIGADCNIQQSGKSRSGKSDMCRNELVAQCITVDRPNVYDSFNLQNTVRPIHAQSICSLDAQNIRFTKCNLRDQNMLLQQTEQLESSSLVINHYLGSKEVDFTSCYSSDMNSFNNNLVIDCQNDQNLYLLKRAQARAGEATYTKLTGVKIEQVENGINGSDENILFTDGTSSNQRDIRVPVHGAIDYRIRMLGAGDAKVLSHSSVNLQDEKHSQSVSDSDCQISAGTSQILFGSEDTEAAVFAKDSELSVSSCSLDLKGVNGSQVTASSEHSVSKFDSQSDESTDTGCESDEDDDSSAQPPGQLELVPAYVHADFKNDFGELFDDYSPGFDNS